MHKDNSISLNKYLSDTGLCSRRQADKLIEAGRIRLNGVIAQKGNRVLPGDEVSFDEVGVGKKAKPIYLAFNKPAGITCTTDRRDPDNIIDFIGHPQRIFPVGRLDKASTGLILLTNDGNIVNKILRVENAHEKEYIVGVNKPITSAFLSRMSNGIPILGTVTKKCELEKLSKKLFRITLKQGLNRQIRRMCEFLNYRVLTLKRERIMHITCGNLRPGEVRKLNKVELDRLKDQIA